MSLGSECFHQYPAIVQVQTMNKRNHSKRSVGEGSASFALSPRSVTKQVNRDSSGLSGMLQPLRVQAMFCAQTAPQLPVPSPCACPFCCWQAADPCVLAPRAPRPHTTAQSTSKCHV